jgi:hypothetical protein
MGQSIAPGLVARGIEPIGEPPQIFALIPIPSQQRPRCTRACNAGGHVEKESRVKGLFIPDDGVVQTKCDVTVTAKIEEIVRLLS